MCVLLIDDEQQAPDRLRVFSHAMWPSLALVAAAQSPWAFKQFRRPKRLTSAAVVPKVSQTAHAGAQ